MRLVYYSHYEKSIIVFTYKHRGDDHARYRREYRLCISRDDRGRNNRAGVVIFGYFRFCVRYIGGRHFASHVEADG